MPKTGSTALQVFFARNHAALLARGVDYARIGEFAAGESGGISSGNGAHLARCLLPPGNDAFIADPEPHFAALFDAIENSQAATGLISSELFAHADPARLGALAAMLRAHGLRTRAFYFIRIQDQLLSANYVQMVKRHGFTGEPDAFVLRDMAAVPFLRVHQYYRTIAGIFGEGGVSLAVYGGACTRPGGLCSAALAGMCIDAAGLEPGADVVNPSLAGPMLGLMLALNRFHPRMELSDLVVQAAQARGLAPVGAIHHLLRPETVDQIERYFAGENAALAREYFRRERLFETRPFAAEVPAPAALSREEVIDILGELLVRQDRRVAALESALPEADGAKA
jgi:hypothetical protein